MDPAQDFTEYFERFDPSDKETYDPTIPQAEKTEDQLESDIENVTIMGHDGFQSELAKLTYICIKDSYESNSIHLKNYAGLCPNNIACARQRQFLDESNNAVNTIVKIKEALIASCREMLTNSYMAYTFALGNDWWRAKERAWYLNRQIEFTKSKGLVDYLLQKYSPQAFNGQKLTEKEAASLMLALQLLCRASVKCVPSTNMRNKWTGDVLTAVQIS